jgi:hypothetical protein
VEIVSIKPYSSVNDHFTFFYAGVDGIKLVLNNRQQREVAPSPQGLQWFTTKPLGFLVEPQN